MKIVMTVVHDGGTVRIEQDYGDSRRMCDLLPNVDTEVDEVGARLKAAMRVQS